MSVPNQRNSSFTAEYDSTGRQILNNGVAEGAVAPAPPPAPVVIAPGAPQNVQMIGRTTSSISISWTDPITGDPAATFIVSYRPQNTSVWIDLGALDKAIHSTTVFSLIDNATYELTVRAINSAGSNVSNIVVVTTLATQTATPPGPPTNLVLGNVTDSSIAFTFSAPTSGSVPSDYFIEYKLTTASSWTQFNDGVSVDTVTNVTGLVSNATYNLRVVATNAAGGPGQPSPVLNATTTLPATAIPDSPVGVSGISGIDGTTYIFQIVNAAPTGQPASSFVFEYKLASSDTWIAAGEAASAPFTFTGLTSATLYDFRVFAKNAAGLSTGTSGLRVTTGPATAPAKITGVTALQLTSNSILLTWEPLPAAQLIERYIIKYWKTSTPGQVTTAEVFTTVVPSDELNIPALTPATSYSFQVAGRNNYNLATVGPNSDVFITSTINNTGYTATNLGIGVNWSDAGDPQEPGVPLPRSPQQSYWTITGRANPPTWLNKAWIKIVRLPFNWEAIQPTPFGPLNTTEFNNLKASVTALLGMGKKVMVDCHNFGRHNGFVIGSATLPTNALADLWGKLAGDPVWKDNQNVMFNLMNEPAIPLTQKLVETQNLACVAIRNTGATNPIVASGNFWSGARNWTLKEPNPTQPYNEKGQQAPNYNDGDWAVCVDYSSAEKMHEVYDPGHNLWWDIHQYFDSANAGGSNTIDDIVTPATLISWMDRVTTWARTYGQRCILGETGGGDVAAVKTAIDTIRTYVAANSDVWGGIVWWPASWRMQYAGATVPPIQNMYREDLQPGFISNQEYWIQGLTPPGGGVTYPTKAQINMLPASNTIADATDPSRANIGGFTISDNPWGVDNSDGTGNLPNGWNVQVGANALTDGSISTRVIWNFPTTTPGKDSGPEITAYPEVWVGDENGAAPQSPDTFFPRSVGSITTCIVDIKYDPTSTTSGEGQLVLDNWYRNPAGTTILECMIVVRPHGGYGVPNSPAAAVAGRTGEATGRNMTNYVGSRVTIGGIAYDICRNPAGYMNAWAMYIFIPATFPDAMSFDIKAINNWLVADGIINASTVMYALANGDEIRPRMTRPSSGDVLFNTKVTKS